MCVGGVCVCHTNIIIVESLICTFTSLEGSECNANAFFHTHRRLGEIIEVAYLIFV